MDLPICAYVILGIIAIILIAVTLFVIGLGYAVLHIMFSNVMDFFYQLLGKPPYNNLCTRADSGMYYFVNGRCVGEWSDCYHTRLIRYDK